MKMSMIFLLGLGMGTLLGILVAPESGKSTCKKIRDEADRLIDKALTKSKLKALTGDPDNDAVKEDYVI